MCTNHISLLLGGLNHKWLTKLLHHFWLSEVQFECSITSSALLWIFCSWRWNDIHIEYWICWTRVSRTQEARDWTILFVSCAHRMNHSCYIWIFYMKCKRRSYMMVVTSQKRKPGNRKGKQGLQGLPSSEHPLEASVPWGEISRRAVGAASFTDGYKISNEVPLSGASISHVKAVETFICNTLLTLSPSDSIKKIPRRETSVEPTGRLKHCVFCCLGDLPS